MTLSVSTILPVRTTFPANTTLPVRTTFPARTRFPANTIFRVRTTFPANTRFPANTIFCVRTTLPDRSISMLSRADRTGEVAGALARVRDEEGDRTARGSGKAKGESDDQW